MNLSCAVHGEFILITEFIHTENGNDILQFSVFLQDLLHAASNAIVLFADDIRLKNTRGRLQRIDGGIDALLCNFTA